MGFLVITCIEPAQKFLGFFRLPCSMIIMAVIIIAIAGYTYYEAGIYFEKITLFGFINRQVYGIIEVAIAALLFLAYLLKKESYNLLMYLITFAHAGFGLAINVQKISVLEIEDSIIDAAERTYIQWLYFIRIGAEFILELIVCYMVYSFKKNVNKKK